MKFRILVAVFLPAVMLAADGQSAAKANQNKQKPVRAAQPKVAAAQTVPSGAEKVDVGSWRYKDPAGKTWIYRQTPFGLVHFEEKTEAEEPLPPGMKAVEDGESVRFERPGPFGTVKWVRPKLELTDVERKVWERDSKKADATDAARSPETAKPAGK